MTTTLPLASAQPVALTVAVDCGNPIGPLSPFWHSCGYSPAEAALRPDGIENTFRVGAAPLRGISQVRVHFLLDLLVVTGFVPNATAPGGYTLLYDWSLLDYAIDTIVVNRLSPGFEFMGSPPGFPPLPTSFYTPWSNNFRVSPTQTLEMFRALVKAIAVRYGARYGLQEISTWNFETWNEPECGWGWPDLTNTSDPAFIAYQLSYDAAAAGIADAEEAMGVKLILGGPGSCRTVDDSPILQWVLKHADNGMNVWTGAPARLDFLSIHFKGRNTSFLVTQQALAAFTWMREEGGGNIGPKVASTPFYNDEADPMVGWLDPVDWRADARYSSIVPKEVNQHLLQINDNNTVTMNNPLGLISFDGCFLNMDGYNGFSQRTMMGRFTDTSTGKYALVRKQSFHVMAMMSRLGATRVSYSGQGAAGPGEVALSSTGVIATSSQAGDGSSLMNVAVLVYNSNDTATIAPGGVGDARVSISLNNIPFSSTDNVMMVIYQLDDSRANPFATWNAQGSPSIPSTQQLLSLWENDSMTPASPPTPIAISQSKGTITIPSFTLPLPGTALIHLVARGAGSPPPPSPSNLVACVKDPSLSLLNAQSYNEILLRWDCAAPKSGSTGGNITVPSIATFGYEVDMSTSGANGPWTTVQAASFGDSSCAFLHPAPAPGQGQQLPWYRVAAQDYWGVLGAFSEAVQAAPWPAIA